MKKKNVFKLVGHRDNFPFFKEILEMGYHVFSMENAKLPGYYPNAFPDYPGVDYRQLRVGDVITIRVFFRIGAGRNVRADGGYMDLEVEHIEGETVFGVIQTRLPDEFPLQKGDSLELYPDEILYKTQRTEH